MYFRKPYFRKHIENFVNLIRFLWPLETFLINNFLLIPAKVVIYFLTVFRNFILFIISISDRSFVFIWTRFQILFRFTESRLLRSYYSRFHKEIVFISCSYFILWFRKQFTQTVVSVVDFILWDLSICRSSRKYLEHTVNLYSFWFLPFRYLWLVVMTEASCDCS